jgi:enoyl-CoA hydratase
VSNNIDVEIEQAVMTITLNRPEKLNAITPEMNTVLVDAIGDAMADEGVHAVRLRGAGRAFSAGADLGMAAAGGSARLNAPADMVANRARVQGLLNLWASPKPIIAQVHGYCLGIATEIVACADLVICAESSRIGMPETRDIALPPTLAFWPATIGVALTKDLLFTGRLLDGNEAVDAGLASRVVSDDELDEAGFELARHVAEVPIHRLAVIKQAINAWVEDTWVPSALRGAEYHALYHQASREISDPSQ